MSKISRTASLRAAMLWVACLAAAFGALKMNLANKSVRAQSGQILQSRSSTETAITYQFVLTPGQTLRAGSNFAFAAQTGGSGTTHQMNGDTYTVTYKAGGASYTQTGHF